MEGWGEINTHVGGRHTPSWAHAASRRSIASVVPNVRQLPQNIGRPLGVGILSHGTGRCDGPLESTVARELQVHMGNRVGTRTTVGRSLWRRVETTQIPVEVVLKPHSQGCICALTQLGNAAAVGDGAAGEC